ncbi:SHOCT domain-containing protein [Candidatus Altiarchaeota archaeon]
MVECPHCKSEIEVHDQVCGHCGKKVNWVFEDGIDYKAEGHGGNLILKGDKVIIERKGALAFMTHGPKGNKEISIESISAIELKKPGWTSGYIGFSFHGGKEHTKGFFTTHEDENSVLFLKNHEKGMVAIKELIEERIKGLKKGEEPKKSGLDDLEKLAELKEKGIITQEEFEAKKKQILNL